MVFNLQTYNVQAPWNRFSQEVLWMNSDGMSIQRDGQTEIKVERIYVGNKTPQELLVELIKKRREPRGLFP